VMPGALEAAEESKDKDKDKDKANK
jgi:hypothetical protein